MINTDYKNNTEYIIGSKKNISIDNFSVLDELRNSILNEKDPAQRALGVMELNNPSINPTFEIVNRGTRFEDMLLTYTAEVHKDKVGVDFMTNQPKYRTREVFLESGKTLDISHSKNKSSEFVSDNYVLV